MGLFLSRCDKHPFDATWLNSFFWGGARYAPPWDWEIRHLKQAAEVEPE